jgi:hypothetical protein
LVAAVDVHAGEQPVNEGVYDRRQEDEVRLARAFERPRQGNQARQRARSLHDCPMTRSAEGITAVQANDEVQALVENPRERSRRVERRRAQQRNDLGAEILLEPNALRGRPIITAYETDAGFAQRRYQLVVEHAVLLRDERVRFFGDRSQHVRGAQVVGACWCGVDRKPVFQTGHSNLEKLIEVRRRNAEEFEPFEQWSAGVHRLFQHAQVERKLRQLAVDVVIRQLEIQRVQVGSTRSFEAPTRRMNSIRRRVSGPSGLASHCSVRGRRRCNERWERCLDSGGRTLLVAVQLPP